MSDKKKRVTYSKQFKKTFILNYQKESDNHTFQEYCEIHNIRHHTAKGWYAQLKINSKTKNLKKTSTFAEQIK